MKNRKLASICALFVALGMVACGGNDKKVDPATCEHEYELVKDDDAKHHEKCKICGDEKAAKSHSWKADPAKPDVAATCVAEGTSNKICACGATKSETVAKKTTHTVVDDTTKKGKDATCAADGTKWVKCSVQGCTYSEEVADPTKKSGGHTWVAGSPVAKVDGVSSGYRIDECSTCHKKQLAVDALSWTEVDWASGNNKDSSNKTLKFSKNGASATYKITVPASFTGECEVALYGWVDYWKDGSNNNDQKGHIVSGNATFSLKVDGKAVEVTNDKSFEAMGMTAGEGGNGAFWPCPLGGTVTLTAGEHTFVYGRLGSYNLNITEIRFIQK